VTIVRTEVADPLVYGELVGQTGYLRLPDFSLENAVLLHYQLEALLNAGARRLVLDLRDNPGGLIAATVVVASEFLSGGLVVVTDGPEGITDYHVEKGGLATSGVPLTVLVNEGSAFGLRSPGRSAPGARARSSGGSHDVWQGQRPDTRAPSQPGHPAGHNRRLEHPAGDRRGGRGGRARRCAGPTPRAAGR